MQNKGARKENLYGRGERCRYGLHNRSCARERDVKKKGYGERDRAAEADGLIWERSKHVRRC